MKIFLDASLFLRLLVLGCNIHEASSAYELLLSCGNSVVNGSDCTMTCDTKDTTASAIQWLNGSATTAVETVDCTDAGELPYESSCSTPGKFDLKITNAQYGRDSYAWSCASPFGGDTSNATDGNTFVTVPLTRVTLTRPTATSLSCVAVSSPAANVTLYEGLPPSQDNVVKAETSFTRTMDGLETRLTSTVEESKPYYCLADNGVHVVNATIEPAPPTTPSTPVCVCDVACTYVGGVLFGLGIGSYIIYTILIKAVPKKIKVLQIFFVVTMILACVAIIGGGTCTGVTVDKRKSCEGQICDTGLGLSAASLVAGIVVLVLMIFVQGMVMDSAGVSKRPLLGNFLPFPREKDEGNVPSGEKTNTEMKNQNDHKKDDKKDDKKHDKKDDKEKKDEKNVESEDPTGRPLPPRTTQKTSDFASPKPKMKPKEGNGEELKPLRDAPRGGLPSPRVNHNDNDSASSASNVTPHVA